MAEGQVLIKDLLEATEVDDSAYLPIDDGELTKKISVENFNMSSNVTAKAYAEAAAASAQTASDTVANINQKVDQAQGYANAAQTQAGYASTYADNAQTYAGNAQGYANTASGHATNAGASASAASASADAAADNALLAQSWAEGNTGAREGENTNNARYWANKAQSAAQITIDDHLDSQSTNPVENRVIYNALNDMHTGGSNIEITTTQTSLYGKDVTISDGTTTVTETFDLTGKALFEGVLMTGDLTIESTDGTQTARASLTVPYFGNYTKAIAFWTATIAVTTTTSQFNGLTVSAKKSGAVMGTATFSNGSATITVPEQGTYTLEVTLDWKTYTSSSFSVTEETTYNETIDGFIAPISLTTPTSEFYGQSISVTRNGVAVPVSLAFSNSGTASFTALDEGTYLFTLTYGGEPYTASVVVSAETTYSAVIKMWTATINITTASSQMQSQDIDVYKGSAKVATIAFNASGQASYQAHESGTYHFVCTVDGYPFTSADVTVSEETVYSTSITYFGATLNISTSSSDLYSQTITIKKGSTVVGTTAFSAQGSATYTVHETGTYTCECEGYSGSAAVSAETTYSVTINAGLDLSAWITAGSTTDYPLNPSSYADFSALEADEAAVRQLMTVHASVDYLAQATAGDSLMQSVINSDVCAKWINLSDYALDTLYANSDIADEMDTADKYFYGEWGIVDSTTTPPTWGALGNIPIMTDFSAPYGTCLYDSYYSGNQAYKAFDGNTSDYWMSNSNSASGGQYIGYSFPYPVNVRRLHHALEHDDSATAVSTMRVEYSDDNSTWTSTNDTYTIGQTTGNYDKSIDVTDSGYHMHWRVYCQGSDGASRVRTTTLQFYGRELTPLVPTMTADDKPKGQASAKSVYNDSALYKAYKAFDGDDSTYWLSANGETDGTAYVEYRFGEKVKPMMYKVKAGLTGGTASQNSIKIESSDDNFTSDITDLAGTLTFALEATKIGAISGASAKKDFRVRILAFNYVNGASVVHTFQVFGMDYSEKEFAQGSTRKTIYDHGVELEAIDNATYLTKKDYEIESTATDTTLLGAIFTTNTLPLNDYDYIYAKYGSVGQFAYPNVAVSLLAVSQKTNINTGTVAYKYSTASQLPDMLPCDLGQVTQSLYVAVGTHDNGNKISVKEIWLE